MATAAVQIRAVTIATTASLLAVSCGYLHGSSHESPRAEECITADATVRDSALLMIDGTARWYTDHVTVDVKSGQVRLGPDDTLRATLAVPTRGTWRFVSRGAAYTGDEVGPAGMMIVPLRFVVPIPRGAVGDSAALVFVLSLRTGITFAPHFIVPAATCPTYRAPPSAAQSRGSSVPRTHTE